jgi:cephalosporin-C deacetylase
MAIYEASLEKLRDTRAHVTAPPDLDEFWAAALAADAANPLAATFTPVASPLAVLESCDVTFAGANGDPIRAWLHLPAARPATPLPGVVEFIGYGGGRGLVHQNIFWAAAGYAHLVMDTRGQGSAWSPGDTPDPHGSAPSHPGFLTRGVLDPAQYYYRRVFGDAVRAVETARSHPAVDADRVVAVGGSQGGGIALAMATLSPHVRAALPDVPFLCDIQQACVTAERGPYPELANYLSVHRDHVDTALRTVSYVDGAVLATRATVPALFSVAMMDAVCPPATVYAAYNNYGGPKAIEEYRYNDHEGGGAFHQQRQAAWLRELLSH